MPNLRVVAFHEDVAAGNAVDETTWGGRMQVTKLPTWPRSEADVYLCGPVAFMQEQWRALLDAGVPAQRLYREVFGPELLNFLN